MQARRKEMEYCKDFRYLQSLEYWKVLVSNLFSFFLFSVSFFCLASTLLLQKRLDERIVSRNLSLWQCFATFTATPSSHVFKSFACVILPANRGWNICFTCLPIFHLRKNLRNWMPFHHELEISDAIVKRRTAALEFFRMKRNFLAKN